ncbi:MAG TPA: NAD+ synthase [Solirubrobacteraceae bacterium]|nr:NAD+ synthase [Solirubrobacteraceae bacterium]
MSGLLKLALCQMNPTVGDIGGNEAKIVEGMKAAVDAGAQLVLFPELAITGYPPEDLLLKEHFLLDARAALERVAEQVHGIVALVGFPERADDVYNACAVLADGVVQGIYRKMLLPNYGVFDEHRYFQTGTQGSLLQVGDVTVGLTICEDIWEPGPPASDEALADATVLINISASPYHAGKGAERERMLTQRARDNLAAVVFCALVGGQDELVFDGHSIVIDHEGRVIARASQFQEELLIATVDPEGPRGVRLRDPRHRPAVRRARPEVATIGPIELPAGSAERGSVGGPVAELLEPCEEIYTALILGLRDYVEKNGFGRVVLGLSGGIDSALVACIAVDALGPDRVSTVIMPSPYSSSNTQDDARGLAENIGAERIELPIEPAMRAYRETLAAPLQGRPEGITQENLQARIRGNLLMALSNEFGWLVLTTGNKSEMSVGYTTLYGDAAGGFAVIKDVSKTRVYQLARHRNLRIPAPIPPSIIDRAPSAELRHEQRDDDSLPPYSVLDPILDGYIENDLGREQLILRGFDPAAVDRVIKLVDRAEYKRRQAPPGIKISVKAFGRDRRVPITNRYGG